MTSQNPPAQDHRFPCDQCGADFRFDPDEALLVCDHCGNTAQPSRAMTGADAAPLAPSPNGLQELDYDAAIQQALPETDMEEARVSACPNCGAQVELGTDTHAAECPFCATPVVTDTGAHRQIKPQALLPFALEESDARKAMTDWLGKLWFAPGGLQEYSSKGRKMQGIYVPYWTFDADTTSDYRGERGSVYQESDTVMRDGKKVKVTRTKVRWHNVTGRIRRTFDDVMVLASRALPKRYTDALSPWDLSALKPYGPEYLSGFRSEAYTVSLEDGMVEARQFMDRVIESDARADIGGDRQRVHDVSTTLNDVTFKHILLPVWMAAYKYKGESYRFVVNGRTGRVQGERPYSRGKIAIAIGIVVAVIAGIGYLMSKS